MALILREMEIADYPEVMDLWQRTEGVGLSASDARDSIDRFLERNPGLSFIALVDGAIAGTVVCGHDGRRGYIYHLAVADAYRRQGIGDKLVDRCLDALNEAGIDKCHLFVFRDNDAANTFWRDTGWTERTDLNMMSRMTDSGQR